MTIEAKNYADYDEIVRPNQGLKPEDLTNINNLKTKIMQSSKKYTVGPFSIKYTEEKGDVSFSGISKVEVIGYNKDKQQVKTFDVEKFVIANKEVTPQYFEPDSTLKTDKTEQVYPKSEEQFEIVFTDPNSGLDANDPNRVAYISLKVTFKYMLSNGEYTCYRGEKHMLSFSHMYNQYGNHDHGYKCGMDEHTHVDGVCSGWVPGPGGSQYISCSEDEHTHTDNCKDWCGPYFCTFSDSPSTQQDIIAADAIRSIYEQELEVGKDTPIDITFDIGGNVWEDIRAGKEGNVDGTRQDSEPKVANVPVILFDKDEKKVAETKTDGDGAYKFEKLDAMKKYYVQFKYNGQDYENTIYEDKLDGKHSTATETTSERDEYNKNYEVINGDEGYTKADLNFESDKHYTSTAFKEMSAYTGSNGKDALIKYPKEDNIVISEQDITVAGVKYNATYKEDNSIKKIDFGIVRRMEFDMALKKDVYVATVKINGKTEVYGYDKKNLGANDGEKGSDTWNITVVGGYDRGLDNADWTFKGENGNNQLLEVYITYKIAVRNQSQTMLGHVTKLYDYYDDTFTYQENLSWQNRNNYGTDKATLDKLQDDIEKQNVSSWGTKPKATAESGKLTIDVDKKQQSGETEYIYLTFKINNKDDKVSLGTKYNKVEIGEFVTYYKSGTTLWHYNSTNSYSVPDDNMIAGRVDRDSIPSTLKSINAEPQEDDEDKAPDLAVKLTGEYRKLNGTAWEDERNLEVDGAIIGDGLKGDKEARIAGVNVQLVEKTVQGKEYVWKTTTTDNNGAYSFTGYIPGDYIIRFTYGDSLETVQTTANGGKHIVSYNGQDYKSTIYQAGVTQTEYTDLDGYYKGYTNAQGQNETGTYRDLSKGYGYNIAKSQNEKVSDAKDIWSKRENVINYSKDGVTYNQAEILASPYVDKSKVAELINNTNMTAETGVIVAEVEHNMQSNLENGMPSYHIKDIDLGLVERPKAQLELDKSITNIKVTLGDGRILFDVKGSGDNVIWKDHAEYNLASKKKDGMYNAHYRDNNIYAYRNEVDKLVAGTDKGLVQLTMDEELMHGATIEITYRVKVTNVGEVDYEGTDFYYLAKGANKQVTTKADQVVDYVSNNLQFNSNNTSNNGWSIINKSDLNGIVAKDVADKTNKFNDIIQTTELNASLKPGDATEKTLVLSQLITPENTSDDLTYGNIVEIVKTSNTVGRRMAYSIVGNQDPTADKASEVDSSRAEKVIILPPFGNVHIFYILGAVVAIILISGVVFIIRKVNKK